MHELQLADHHPLQQLQLLAQLVAAAAQQLAVPLPEGAAAHAGAQQRLLLLAHLLGRLRGLAGARREGAAEASSQSVASSQAASMSSCRAGALQLHSGRAAHLGHGVARPLLPPLAAAALLLL